MHISAIIAEYNPLHAGHQYHIEQTRLLTGADYIITVLSGDFVQRGLPAVLSKHERAEMALKAGSDLVLELPVPYALSSAEGFGFGGVSLLHALGCVDTLSFGTESGTLDAILPLADILCSETDSYKNYYRSALKQGFSHPAARMEALSRSHPGLDLSPLDGHSNNLLALEYCKAIKILKSNILPVTLERKGQHYLDTEAPADTGIFASASAIRDSLCHLQNNYTDCNLLNTQIPEHSARIIKNACMANKLLFPEDFSPLLYYRLLTLSVRELSTFWEVTDDFANKICNKLKEYQSFSQFANLLWTKDLTYARVCRCLMHILLDLKEDTWNVHRPVPYARVLGFCKKSSDLLSAIKKNSSIPLITKVADAEKLLSKDVYQLFETDLKAAHIYDSVLQHKSGLKIVHEARKPIIIL